MISSPTYSNASFRDLNSSHNHPCSDVDEQLSLNGTGMTSQNSGNGDVWNNEMNLFVNYMSRIHRDEVSFILISFSSNTLFSYLPFFYLFEIISQPMIMFNEVSYSVLRIVPLAISY